ncbi:hypothetical protein LDENG_00228610 [Lucifuga dentata]|nr:hypothetical protein LDENG_00228610 [Lucifuga dentata]
MIDGKVGLCLAYQPTLRRKLRVGDAVELHHVHFLYRPCPDFPPSMLCTCLRSSLRVTRPCPDFPPSMLCTCLRSSLRVTTFSRITGSSSEVHCPGDEALPRLLLEKNTGLSEYLWICNVTRQLRQSLAPTLLKEECVCVLAWKLMEHVCRGRGRGEKRDIYAEMLDEPHTCPLTQYSVDPSVFRCLTVSDCLQCLQSDWLSGDSLSSLLPPGGVQINTSLSWSYRTLTSDPCQDLQPGGKDRQRPLLLVGVLALPSQSSEHTLQLKDQTGMVSCVVTETKEEKAGFQSAVFNTAWIGCLVCVQQFTMVREKFLQSDFPSYQHLRQDDDITQKHYRVYLQFSLDDVHILSPSVAMVTHLREREESREAKGAARRKRKREEEEKEEEEEAELGSSHFSNISAHFKSHSSHPASSLTIQSGSGSQPCVSMVIRMEQKEGVAWRNIRMDLTNKEVGLSLCFSVKATVIGPVVSWGRDPKNSRMMERETDGETERKTVILLFLHSSIGWFPVLHAGCFYRLVVMNSQDPSILIGCDIAGRRGVESLTDPALQVGSDWRFHTLTHPLLLPVYKQALSSSIMSVSDVLDFSSADLVCFLGLVSERISLNDKTCSDRKTHTGVRLTMYDRSRRSLQVYLNTPVQPGLLPGNKLLLSGFQRKLSKSGSVYCTSLPVSSVSVVALGDARLAPPPPPCIMQLGRWETWCTVGQVKGHVVCFLFLQLQWSCSLCGAIYTQSCSRSPCGSSSPVFQSKAKLVVDDGSGEAHVWFSGPLIRPLLGLTDSQWEGLHRILRVRGHIRVYTCGRSLVCDPHSDDALLQFLLCVCSSDVVCRPISLTCRRHKNSQRTEDLRRFSRGKQDFITRMTPPLQLTCLHLETC